ESRLGASVDTHLLRSMTARRADDPDSALAALDAAQSLNADHPLIHYERGVIAADQGRYEDAVASLQRAIELDASLYSARQIMAAVHLHRGEPSQAAEQLRA